MEKNDALSEELKSVINSCFAEMLEAAKRMMSPTVPATPLPRFRRFMCVLGNRRSNDCVVIEGFKRGTLGSYYPVIRYPSGCTNMDDLVDYVGCHPKKVAKLMHFLRTVTDWCNKRAEGRTRAAGEILCQQGKALAVLEAEIALSKLR